MGELEYPFELTEHTDAKASEVMANFDAVSALLAGGLGPDNFTQKALAGFKRQTGGVLAPGAAATIPGLTVTLEPTESSLLVAFFGATVNKEAGTAQRLTGGLKLAGAQLGRIAEAGPVLENITGNLLPQALAVAAVQVIEAGAHVLTGWAACAGTGSVRDSELAYLMLPA